MGNVHVDTGFKCSGKHSTWSAREVSRVSQWPPLDVPLIRNGFGRPQPLSSGEPRIFANNSQQPTGCFKVGKIQYRFSLAHSSSRDDLHRF